MPAKPTAVFLDFATVGPSIDTKRLDTLLDIEYFDVSAPEEIPDRLAGREIALVNKARLDRETLERSTGLRFIALAATGSDNVDLEAARRSGIGVANARGYCTAALAQHVFALILGLTQQIAGYVELVRGGAWTNSGRFAMFDFPIRELAGRNLGIVGFGTLGRAVAAAGECFGMNVLVSRRPGSDEAADDARLPFDEVLQKSDVLSLHCPLNETTRHLLDAEAFRRMKPDAIVINTARGALIDPQALADALRAGQIGGAGIDVLPVEPPPADDPLLAADIPNLLVTPHVAWAAREARQRGIDQIAENIEAFLAGDELRRLV